MSLVEESIKEAGYSIAEAIDGAAGKVSAAIWGTFQTPNESDRNGEPANVVDGLYAIARGLFELGRVIESLGPDPDAPKGSMSKVRLDIPDALAAPRRNGRG